MREQEAPYIGHDCDPRRPDSEKVICPACCTKFWAIPVNVQQLMLDAGFEPPFTAAPAPQAQHPLSWQPIETAPKDGTDILLYFGAWGWIRGNWDSQLHHGKPKPYWTNDRLRYLGVTETRANQPTHWMPIPPAPNGIGEKQ